MPSHPPERQQALTLHKKNSLPEAIAAYLLILKSAPDDDQIQHWLGIAYAQTQQHSLARQAIEHAIKQNPLVCAYHNSLGNLMRQQQKQGLAIKAYQAALTLNPDYAPAHKNLGHIHLQRDQLQCALLCYQNAARLQPNDSDAYFCLGRLHQQNNDSTQAKNALAQCLKIDADHLQSHHLLGQINLGQGQLVEAIKHFTHCQKQAPHNPDFWYLLGCAQCKQSYFKAAIKTLQQAIALRCQKPDVHAHLATAFLAQGDHKQAQQHYLRQLGAQTHPDSSYNLGVLLMHQERHLEALDYFQQALSEPQLALATHTNMATIYLKTKQLAQATSHFEHVQKLDPNHLQTRHILCALRQEHCTETPHAYISELFDHYAAHYDPHLKQYLSYQAPEQIRQALLHHVADPAQQFALLDLGCGTGLAGQALSDYAHTLVGIDLSEKMLAEAHKKSIYTQLIHQSIEDMPNALPAQDLIVAADVLPYLGELLPIFKNITHALSEKGWFIFTIEDGHTHPFKLQKTVRFAHHLDYIQQTLTAAGMQLRAFEKIILRNQHKEPLTGYLFLAQR